MNSKNIFFSALCSAKPNPSDVPPVFPTCTIKVLRFGYKK